MTNKMVGTVIYHSTIMCHSLGLQVLKLVIKKNGEWLELITPPNWNGVAIEYILKEVWQVPKGMLHQLRMGKKVKVDDEVHPFSKNLNKGEKLQILIFPKEEYGLLPSAAAIEILFEDEHLLIVNKPAGIDTHPNEPNQTNTLANRVAYYFSNKGIETKVRHIHRLDKDTTGAVLFAKNALAGAILDRLLEEREIKRTYLALVEGRMKKQKGTISEPIGRDRHHPTRRRVSVTGQEAVTNYEVLEYHQGSNSSLLKLQLLTGRTHQIRVHLSYLGHPLVGDSLYGGKKGGFSRQALHAAKISLPHPITNERISCIAPFIDNPQIFTNEHNRYL